MLGIETMAYAQPISIHVCCPGDENNLADMAVRHAA
ncbi:unnamed protein product, partial [Tenebrio molitor]